MYIAGKLDGMWKSRFQNFNILEEKYIDNMKQKKIVYPRKGEEVLGIK